MSLRKRFLLTICIIILICTYSHAGMFDRFFDYGSKPLFVEFEIGPNLMDFKAVPMSILPRNDEDGSGGIFSFWSKAGLKFSNWHYYISFKASGDAGVTYGERYLDEDHSENTGELGMISPLTLQYSFIKSRIMLNSRIGYNWVRFKAYNYPDETKSILLKKAGLLLGTSFEFIFKQSVPVNDISIPIKKYAFAASIEQTFIDPNLLEYSLALIRYKGSDSLILKFRYIDYKDICRVYALTFGGRGYFGF